MLRQHFYLARASSISAADRNWCGAYSCYTPSVPNTSSLDTLKNFPAYKQTDGRRVAMIRKLKSGKYRLYSSKKDPKTGKRKNLGTFDTRAAAEKHEHAVQYFKHKG